MMLKTYLIFNRAPLYFLLLKPRHKRSQNRVLEILLAGLHHIERKITLFKHTVLRTKVCEPSQTFVRSTVCLKSVILRSMWCSPAKKISKTRFCDLLCRGFRSRKYNGARLKIKYVLSIIAVLAGNTVQIQADEASPTRRAFAQLNYQSVSVTMNKGVELADKGDYEKARQYFDAAIGQDPKAWPIYLNRANVFVHQRKFDLAIQDLNTVLRLRPGVLLVQVLRGLIYEHLGDYRRALAD